MTRLLRLLDRLLADSTRRLAEDDLAHRLARRQREGVPTWQTR